MTEGNRMIRSISYWSAALLITIAAPAHAQDPDLVLRYNSDLLAGGVSENRHHVQQGETLYSILLTHFGHNADLPSLARATLALNPRAFRGGDMNRLLAGQTITLPHGAAGPSEPDDIHFF
ncbi:FimV family protein [Lacimonas salitolerans]|uniref:FimV family protein n=1 Tax=Lacimonas salitolerans TaxID=1323750 RepID=A0ABW4EGY7_9RHOB